MTENYPSESKQYKTELILSIFYKTILETGSVYSLILFSEFNVIFIGGIVSVYSN